MTDRTIGFMSQLVLRGNEVAQRPSIRRPSGLSPETIAQRRAASFEAIENARLEGLPISEETKAIMDAHDRGEIDKDEMKRRVMRQHVRSA